MMSLCITHKGIAAQKQQFHIEESDTVDDTKILNDLYLNDLYGSQNIDVIDDPWENFNRKIFKFNEKADKAIIAPSAKLYRKVTINNNIRKKINNFLSNFEEPVTMINSIFQCNAKTFGQSTFRFMINTTFGLFGLFDIAAKLKVKPVVSTFNNTMAKYNVYDHKYLVLPILGPSTERQTLGLVFDIIANPLNYIFPHLMLYSLYTIKVIGEREAALDKTEQISQLALDKYAITYSLYKQHIKEHASNK